jgi:hypothetical protein
VKKKERHTCVKCLSFIFCMYFSVIGSGRLTSLGNVERKEELALNYSKTIWSQHYCYYKNKSVFTKTGYMFWSILPSSGEAVTKIYRGRQK